jgi:hypothetical protein
MIMINDVMTRLSKRRPVFHSEADFQHELAYEVRLGDPSLNVRLELPVVTPFSGAIDIIILGKYRFVLELKYLCKRFVTTLDGEEFALKDQSGRDIRRYDVCKDVKRMEDYAERTGYGAAVLVLSNDPAYWQERRSSVTADSAFNISHLRKLAGTLQWGSKAGLGTIRRREASLDIKGTYELAWREYSKIGDKGGDFRYLWIPVADQVSA